MSGSNNDSGNEQHLDEDPVYTFDDLERLLAYLRDPQYGCPWDVAQTPDTIVPYTIEEVYEVVEAIELKDWQGLGEELGDLLLQVVFYAQMAKEVGHFDLRGVVDRLVRKMVRRHPHVFPDGRLAPPTARSSSDTPVADVKQTWEAIKQQERLEKSAPQQGVQTIEDASITSAEPATMQYPLAESLAGVPKGLDPLASAQKTQVKAARFGLDWQAGSKASEIDPGVLARLQEEVGELCQAIGVASANKVAASADKAAVAEELGDVLFSCVNLSRHLALDAGQCLRQSTRKFKQRAESVEQLFLAESPGEGMASASETHLEQLWQVAKQQEKVP